MIKRIRKPQEGFQKGHPPYVLKHSEESKKKISLSKIGKPSKLKGRKRVFTKQWIKNMALNRVGKKMSEESRRKISIAMSGNKTHLWKGGVTPINKSIRNGLEFRLWREAVFKRDNWTCVWCKKRGGELHPDHIKPFAYFPELRFCIDNGRTLCIDCHKTTDTYAYKAKNFK